VRGTWTGRRLETSEKTGRTRTECWTTTMPSKVQEPTWQQDRTAAAADIARPTVGPPYEGGGPE
jgi:hypothetical protein